VCCQNAGSTGCHGNGGAMGGHTSLVSRKTLFLFLAVFFFFLYFLYLYMALMLAGGIGKPAAV